MRAYPTGRFSDKAAIYYTAEYWATPEWNPLNKIPYIKKLDTSWMQWVLFFETGRVAPDWDVTELHSSMKWDVGVGIRAFVKGIVARACVAYSTETVGVQMMVGQPF